MTQPQVSNAPIAGGATAWEMLKTNVSAHGALGNLSFEKQRGLWIDVALKLAEELTGHSGHEVVPLGGAQQGLAKVRSWMGFRILTPSKGDAPGDELLVVRFSKAKDNRQEIVPAPFPGEGSGASGEELVKRFTAQYRAACGANPIDRLRPHVIVLFNDLTRPLHPYVPVAKDRLQKYWPQIGGGLVALGVAWWMIGGIASCAHNRGIERTKEVARNAAIAKQLKADTDTRKEKGKTISHPRLSFLFQNLENEVLIRQLSEYLPAKRDASFTISPEDSVMMLKLLPKRTELTIAIRENVYRAATLVIAERVVDATSQPISSAQATSLYRSVEEIVRATKPEVLGGESTDVLNSFSLQIADKFVPRSEPVEEEPKKPASPAANAKASDPKKK